MTFGHRMFAISMLLFILMCFFAGTTHTVTTVEVEHEYDIFISGETLPECGSGSLEPHPPLVYVPEYEVEYTPEIKIRWHDYYNSLVHTAKATCTKVDVIVRRLSHDTTYSFDSLNDVVITFNELDAGKLIYIKILLYANNDVTAVSDSNEYFIRVYFEEAPFFAITADRETTTVKRLRVDDNDQQVIFDYKYPTEGIKHPLTHVERELLSSLVALEHGGGSADAKRAVASVVFNRSEYGRCSIHSVIYAKNAFSPARNINPTTGKTPYRDTDGRYSSCKDAVDYVSLHGSTVPRSVLYFRSGYYHKWSSATQYRKIGSLYFSGNNKLINRYKEWKYYK